MPATTTLPSNIGATADLPIKLTVINGCTRFVNVEVLERTTTKVRLQTIGTPQQPCPAVPNAVAFSYTYMDSGGTPRTNPFEVWVNGSKISSVTIE